MSHPYSGHREMSVGHRRAKLLTTGKQYARGGHADAAEDKKLIKSMLKKEDGAEGKATGGSVASGRLDKKARGGTIKKLATGGDPAGRTIKEQFDDARVESAVKGLGRKAHGGPVKGYQLGGGIHKITPSKHKPHVSVHIANISRGGGGGGGGTLRRPPPIVPPMGGAPPMGGPPPMAGPGMPPPGMPPMKRGGRTKAFAAGGRMRSGKKYGEGSGEGRLEEYKHMKGR